MLWNAKVVRVGLSARVLTARHGALVSNVVYCARARTVQKDALVSYAVYRATARTVHTDARASIVRMAALVMAAILTLMIPFRSINLAPRT